MLEGNILALMPIDISWSLTNASMDFKIGTSNQQSHGDDDAPAGSQLIPS